jgi:hypothetical protein
MAAAHEWVEDACLRCGLRRREEWVLDSRGRAVMALVWTDDTGDRQVQPFPFMKGLQPPGPVAGTVAQAFPGLPVGHEPECESPAATEADVSTYDGPDPVPGL